MNLKAIKGDVTTLDVDAIVNAANSSLMGGGGVDGAIHRAGGPDILDACKKIIAVKGRCQTGEAVITTAGEMRSRFVIHTVGPVWHGGSKNESKLLANCYTNSLKLAIENKCKTVAFPNISTGAYHFPKDKAAIIAVEAVKNFAELNKLEEIIFVCFDDENFTLINQHLNEPY